MSSRQHPDPPGGGKQHPPPHPALRTQVAYNVEVDAGDEGIAGEYDEAKKQYKVVITKVWRVRAARLVTRRVLQRTTPVQSELGDGAHPIPSSPPPPPPPPPHTRLPHLPSPTVDAVRHTQRRKAERGWPIGLDERVRERGP